MVRAVFFFGSAQGEIFAVERCLARNFTVRNFAPSGNPGKIRHRFHDFARFEPNREEN
jgi:hypothetical protein